MIRGRLLAICAISTLGLALQAQQPPSVTLEDLLRRGEPYRKGRRLAVGVRVDIDEQGRPPLLPHPPRHDAVYG